ncbi:MAG: Asp-tRNA(Asn)/Glu-tRNA(Gln) amidotransferase subunit GatB [Patescibacteria group bacterium]
MSIPYKTTIGLEIHAELKTKSKMFCGCKNDTEEKRPNINICPICMAHPGALPVINKEAFKHVIKVGMAIGGKISDFTEFDRKNYFYPDIPKGYQISQYKYPIVSGGSINGVAITRVHLEEDTARSSHDKGNYSLIDFNRAGVPLMELVTEPVVKSAEEASAFAKELQLVLRYLGASDANMEKGEMRVEANISVSKDENFGTKVEVKNLNSFKVVEKAIAHEIARQIELLEEKGEVVQETRGWDENKEETFSQRMKESSHDYRYFPDPDLPKIKISEMPEFSAEMLKKEIPELPWEKRERFMKELGIKREDAEMYLYDEILCKFFEEVSKELGGDKKLIGLSSNYISSDLAGLTKNNSKNFKVSPANFTALVKMVSENKISSRGAKDLLALLFEKDTDPEKLAQEKGLLQKSDQGELEVIVKKIIKDNPKVVAEYKAGKSASLQFLIGQGMKESHGSANPQVLRDILTSLLK